MPFQRKTNSFHFRNKCRSFEICYLLLKDLCNKATTWRPRYSWYRDRSPVWRPWNWKPGNYKIEEELKQMKINVDGIQKKLIKWMNEHPVAVSGILNSHKAQQKWGSQLEVHSTNGRGGTTTNQGREKTSPRNKKSWKRKKPKKNNILKEKMENPHQHIDKTLRVLTKNLR